MIELASNGSSHFKFNQVLRGVSFRKDRPRLFEQRANVGKTRAVVRNQQPARSRFSRDLRGLNRGRMAEMMRLFDQLFGEGRLVDQPVGLVGQFDGVRAGSRVQTVTDDLPGRGGPRTSEGWITRPSSRVIDCPDCNREYSGPAGILSSFARSRLNLPGFVFSSSLYPSAKMR